jgi:signal transduction histidine kinase
MLRSLRTRLTLWYTVALGVTLLGFGLLIDRAFVHTLSREFDKHLVSAAGAVEFAVRDVVQDFGLEAAAARVLTELRFVDIAVAIRANPADGPPVIFTGSDPVLVRGHPAGPCREEDITRRRLNGTPYRVLTACVRASGALPALSLVVGASERPLVAQSRRAHGFIALLLVVGVTLTTLGGHWLSGKAIAPIRRMARRVRDIGSENLHERLPVTHSEGEVAELSVMVNGLFQRLEATIGRERQFLHNAAHALRTPIAVLQGAVAETPRRDELAEIEALIAHLGRTVDYLLALGRRDAGLEPIARQTLYLDDVVSGTVSRLGRIAERQCVRLQWGELRETPVLANAHAVDQVVQILLENAIQYTPAGGTITISVRPVNGTGRLVVQDTGAGLSPDELGTLFTPFVRGSAARVSGTPGSGLGLAVARWLVESCGGTITAAASQPHGAQFVVEFSAPSR